MFNIPNSADAEHVSQAQPDSRDFSGILVPAFQGTGIITGCAVTAQGAPNMTVAVAAGQIAVGGTAAVVTGGNVAITAADPTNARFDLICVDNTGAKTAVAGVPAVAPVFPDPAGKVVIAAVRVPAGVASINAAKIVDKRVGTLIIAATSLPGYPNDVRKQLNGDGSWSYAFLGGSNKAASYELALADGNSLLEMNVAAANTLTVPPDSAVAFPVGTTVEVGQMGAGQTSIVAGAGVTLRAYNNNLRLAGINAMCSLIKRNANDWWLAGNLVP